MVAVQAVAIVVEIVRLYLGYIGNLMEKVNVIRTCSQYSNMNIRIQYINIS